jgi:hypothetical protein
MHRITWIVSSCICALIPFAHAADLRLGIVGTDTSHVTAFTALLNAETKPVEYQGARVVTAYKGGSPDIESSANRVEQYAAELHSKFGVEIVPDIPTLLTKVDAILLTSVDGRVHLAQLQQILKAHKPVFIDKPLAATIGDVREIARLAHEAGVPWFTASALRFSEVLPGLKLEGLNGAFVYAPGPLEPHHELDLSWYGVHGIEVLYTLLGPGCEEVSRTHTAEVDIVVGRWKDGRTGVLRLNRPYSGYGATVFSPKVIRNSDKDLNTGYGALVAEIVRFFKTGKPPVEEKESLEMYEFMDAALRSMNAGGAPAKLR